MLHVKQAKYLEEYKIWLSFDDGSVGEVDLSDCLSGPVFDPLKDLSYFRNFHYDEELQTIVWPNGVDLAPEFLRSKLK